MQTRRFTELFYSYLRQHTTEEESREFMEMAADPSYYSLLKSLSETHDSSGNLVREMDPEAGEQILQAILAIQKGVQLTGPLLPSEEKITYKKLNSKPGYLFMAGWLRYAAILLILMGAATYIYLSQTSEKDTAPVLSAASIEHDIPSAGNRAKLTLSDGSVIVLDSVNEGMLSAQGNVSIVKLKEGQLAYFVKGAPETEVKMNTLSTPKGGQYQVALPDGSIVWLNAASTLRYPTAFVGKERLVEINGEAYFEVAKQANMPFKVKINNETTIEVLGTSFNVNAYDDEAEIITTLLEGSIRFRSGSHKVDMRPGEQANLAHNHSLSVSKAKNLDLVIGWKNGYFYFENDPLQKMMREMGRWYDVDIVFEKNVNKEEVYTGQLQRNLSLKQLINLLKGMNLTLKLTDRTLTVMNRK